MNNMHHENSVPSRLPEWLCGKSGTWVLYIRLRHCSSCAQVHRLPQSHCGDNQEGTLFSWLHIYYACLASMRFEHCVLWITYDHLCNIYIHRQVWEEITWYRCETSHVIFPCFALGALSVPQSIELRHMFE